VDQRVRTMLNDLSDAELAAVARVFDWYELPSELASAREPARAVVREETRRRRSRLSVVRWRPR
jgi:hypothetical protein